MTLDIGGRGINNRAGGYMTKTVLSIERMPCGGSLRRVPPALIPPAAVAAETAAAALVRVRLDPTVTPELRVAETIQDAGCSAGKPRTR
jgi:hypothetical protein